MNTIVFENDIRASYKKLAEDMTAYFKLSDKDKACRPERIRKEAKALIGCDPASRKHEIERLIIQRLLLGIDIVPARRRKPSTRPKKSAASPLHAVAASVSKVVCTAELLEAILSHLPVLDLVVATGIDKAFRTLILSLPTLRRNLFLLPRIEEPEKMRIKLYTQDGETRQRDEYIKTTLCPLLRLRYSRRAAFERYRGEEADIEYKALGAFAWSKMYLTNPPCTTVDVQLGFSGQDPRDVIEEVAPLSRHDSCYVRRTIHDQQGVTFDALFEVPYMKGKVRRLIGEGNDSETQRLEWPSAMNSSLFEQLEAWEDRCGGSMKLDYDLMRVTPRGVALPHAED